MSGATFPNRFTKVDDLTRPDHSYLNEDDDCYFLGEYTAREGFTYSKTNSLILNFKKSMDRLGRPEWRHKGRAIREAAAAFRSALNPEALDRLTFVPIPPSKARGDPLYDDRVTQMLHGIRPDPRLDIRELIIQNASTDAFHGMEIRPRPEALHALYQVNEALTDPAPTLIAVVDDLLTTGAHFRAADSILSARFPGAEVIGLFIARRAPNTADLEDFGDIEF